MSSSLMHYYDYAKRTLFNGGGGGSLVRTIDDVPQNGVMDNFLNICAFALIAAYMGYLIMMKSKNNNKVQKKEDNINPIPHFKNTYNKYNKYTDDQLNIPKTDEWKHTAWKKWMVTLEDRWDKFINEIDKNKSEWMDKKDAQLIEWVKELQAKWLHFNPNIDQEYKIEFLKKSESWSDDKWKIWMLTEAQQLLENDLKEWLSQAEAEYCKWTMDSWRHWKDSQIKEWITLDWKYEEDNFFSKVDEFSVEVLPIEERRLWYAWKERIYKEGSDWKYWTSLKESKLVNENWELWEEWKTEKQEMFNEWLQLYTHKWIQQKQWRLWIGEKMSHERNKSTSESIIVGASPAEIKTDEKKDDVKDDEKKDEIKIDEKKADVKDDEKKDDSTSDVKGKFVIASSTPAKADDKKDEVKKDDSTSNIKNRYSSITNSTIKADEKKEDSDASSLNGDDYKRRSISNPYLRNSKFI